MQRACLLMIAAAVLAWFVIGVDGQTPSAQPAPPAPTAAPPPATPTSSPAAPSQNAAPTISLGTQPARQVFSVGERFTVIATANDDADPADRLQYRWTVKNLESGVEQAARSTNLRQVRTRGGAAGRYEYKCIVTDSAGVSGEASLSVSIEDTGNPEVVSLAFDDSTAAFHHVTPYWQEGAPAIRRGDWALMLVSVRNFIAGPHFLKVLVDGNAVTPGASGSAWAVQNLGGTLTEQRIRLFVPPDTAVGRHSIAVAVMKRSANGSAESETSRAAFSPDPVVLFNPWRSAMPDASVYAATPLPDGRAAFYTSGTQDLVMSGLAAKNVYDVTPYEKPVVGLAQEIVAGMPADARGDASRVAAAMAAYVGDKVLQGKWPARNASDPYPNAIKKPSEWRAASEVCGEHLKNKQKVAYGQCWVYGFTLTGLLRSIGIPARTITVLGAGRDLEAEWGVLQTKYDCRKWDGTRCEDSHTASAQEQLSFHTWNEVWIPTVNPPPEIAGNRNNGWAVADATPQTRNGDGDRYVGTPSVKAVRDFPAPQRGQQIPDGDDAAFLYEQINLPWEISWKTPDNNWYQSSGGPGSATHGFVADSATDRSNELLNYGAAPALASALKTTAVQITIGPVVNLRTNATVRISATGLGSAPQRLGVGVLHLPRELSGGTLESPPPGGLVFATTLEVRPAAGNWSGIVEVPGDVLWAAGPYEVVVGPQQGAPGPSGRARFDVRSLPIAVALPARVNAGETFAVSARLINSTSTPVQGATLRLVLPNQFRVVGGNPSGMQDVIPPAGDLRVDAMVQATLGGQFIAGAASESNAGPGEEHAQVLVRQKGRLFVEGEPAVGIKAGETVTVTANVILDGVEPSSPVEVRLESIEGASLSIVGDARKVSDTLSPEVLWTPSWQVLVTAPGVYRLPVRAKTTELGESSGEILLIAGATDPDADLSDDFNDQPSLGYRSAKAIAGLVAVGLAVIGGGVYWVRRRVRGT